ncbi:hypothetical protein [Pontibacter mucosus]|nr:hypothetical protein [Pontibacter mucosus]
MLAGTWVAQLSETDHKTMLHLLNLAKENTIATWYSSKLLLLTSAISAVCFMADRQRAGSLREKTLSYGWVFFSIVFLLLSLDEIGSYHETIGDASVFNLFGKQTGWTVFYILILLVGGFMLSFSVVILVRSKRTALLSFIGLLLLLSNPLQENYEINSYRAAPDPAQWVRPLGLLLLEEGSEIFASSCFLLSTVIYLHYVSRQQPSNQALPTPYININLLFSSKLARTLVFCGTVLLTAGLVAVEVGIGETTIRDEGIPKNWFPSTSAFAASIISTYLYHISRQEKAVIRYTYLLLAALSMYIAMLYGSNLYAHNYWLTEKGMLLEKVAEALSIAAAAFLCYRMLLLSEGAWSRTGTLAWTLLVSAAFLLEISYAVPLTFLAYACLMPLLVEHVYRWKPEINELPSVA